MPGGIREIEPNRISIAEPMGRRSSDGDRAVPVFDIRAVVSSRRREGASRSGDAEERLPLFPVGGLGEHVGATGLVIEQDGFDDGLHIPADSGAVVIEFLDNTIEVIATRVAR